MRIALASIHPRPLSGQIEGLVGLAQALERTGHSVEIVTAFPSQQLLGDDRLTLAKKSHRIFLDQPKRMARIFLRLVRLAPHVDVIHLNLPTPAFSIYADLLQACVRAPVIVGYEAHLVSIRDLLRNHYWRRAPWFYVPRLMINNRLVARMTLRMAKGYVVHSQYCKSELVALGIRADRIRVLPPILPLDKLSPGTAGGPSGVIPAGQLITYVGHYNHVKGVDVLLRAFQLLAPRFPTMQLVLAWSGVGASQSVEQLLSDRMLASRISQLGQMRVADLMRASALVVLPYRMTIGQAAFPATLIEALAAKVPVVTTDLPLLRELTRGGQTALLVPPEDPAALAAAMERILTEPALARQMLDAQQAWAQEIQPERVVKEYEQLYGQVVERQTAVLLTDRDRERV
jgi:glycosyltransferase involved in cell wall biosynthesis